MDIQFDNPPDKPAGEEPGAAPGGSSDATVTHVGATEFSSSQEVADASYTSSKGAENAVLVTGGEIVFSNINVSKTGDDSGDSSDFYGTNAAFFAYNDTKVIIEGSDFATNGSHANAVFAYGNASIDISDSTINTSSNNSGGIMVTGGGTISASDLSVSTLGNSSAAIRSDRGGGTINVEGGKYETSGIGSPAIYSTADITVRDAELVSNASEGVVIEGKNSVSLDGVSLDATNNQLNGQSETYKAIFIYQSMSGDASEGTGTFSANNCTISNSQGDIFFVTNTTAKITLSGNNFIQNDESGAFLRAQAGAWGNSGSNGGKVTLMATDQEINGDIVVDEISSIDLQLNHSYFLGAFTGKGAVSLALSDDSVVVLTADSYLSSLSDVDVEFQNIYSNGYKLFVDGKEVTVNTDEAPESFLDIEETTQDTSTATTSTSSEFPTWGYFAIGGGLLAIVIAILVVVVLKQKKSKSVQPTDVIPVQPPVDQAPTEQITNPPEFNQQ